MPVQHPTKFLVVSLKTAKVFGLTIPQSILLRADEVNRVSSRDVAAPQSAAAPRNCEGGDCTTGAAAARVSAGANDLGG